MRTRRLMGIVALGAAAASILAIPGAGAQDTTYGATADGRALVLTLVGEGLTAGQSHADVTSAPSAAANGAGILNPVSPAGVTEAEATADGQSEGSADETCEGELPEIPGLSADLACSSSLAAITGGLPSSAATARIGSVSVNPIGALLDTDQLDPITGPITDGVDQIGEGLAPLTDPLSEGTGVPVNDFVDALTAAIANGAPLANVTIGQTAADTAATADAVTSTCAADGGRIDVLDQPDVGELVIPPVISVIVGDAATSVSAPTSGGEATATADPAIATVLIPSLELEVPVGPGENIDIPLPQPLGNSRISVAGGETGTDEEGNSFARASAVRIHLFEDSEAITSEAGTGLELALADCTSVAGATVEAPPATTTTTAAPPLLPRTGSDGPNGLAIAAVVGFAALGLTLLRRSKVS